MMRILHVLDHSLPLHSGYTFRTRAILKAQQALGIEVAGVTGSRHATEAPSTGAYETIEGLRFFRGGAAPGGPPVLAELREVRAFAEAIERAARVFRPDVLHAHSPALTALAARRVARRLGIPLVYEIRAFWEDAAVGNGTGREGSLRYRATRALETFACRRADAVAVICEGLRRDLLVRGIDEDKILVSPNGVDLALFGDPPAPDARLARELDLRDAEVVGFIGSFYDYEGIDDLIAAMPALAAARPAAHLLLVGGGPMAEALAAQAAASPAANRIHFVGRVPHAEVERYYGLVDILCYPRKRMRLTELVTPLKPLEAMAQRRLVAASDVGGHRELIEDGVTGTLFAPDDPAAIADALAGLLADRAGWERRREAGVAFVRAERDWAENAKNYLPVYQRLSHQGRKPEGKGPMHAKSWLRRIDRWRFETPLALALAAATLFAVSAMPVARYEALPGIGGLPRWAGAIATAMLFAVIAWFAMRKPKRRPAPEEAEPTDAMPIEAHPEESDAVIRLRRADRHPDAPARAPIRATSELGSPFMEVGVTPPAPVVVDLSPPPVTPAPIAAMTVDTRPTEPMEPAPDVESRPVVVLPRRPRDREHLSAMIDRLSAGLAARAREELPSPPADLRGALDELNRIAARRH